MVSIELWMAKVISFMAIVRSHQRLSNTLEVRVAKVEKCNLDAC